MFVFTHVCSHLYRFILPCTHWFSLKVMCSFLLVHVTCFILAHLHSFSLVRIHFQLYTFIFACMHSFSCVSICFHLYIILFSVVCARSNCSHLFSVVCTCFQLYALIFSGTHLFSVGHSFSVLCTCFQLDALIHNSHLSCFSCSCVPSPCLSCSLSRGTCSLVLVLSFHTHSTLQSSPCKSIIRHCPFTSATL